MKKALIFFCLTAIFWAIIPGLIGVVTLILAIIFLATQRKAKPPLPPHAA